MRMRSKKILNVVLGIGVLVFWGLQAGPSSAQSSARIPLPGSSIPQFVQPLPLLGGTGFQVLDGTVPLTVSMQEFQANILPVGTITPGVQTPTTVWGYIDGTAPVAGVRETYLGPVIVAQRGTPTRVTWINQLGTTATTGLSFWSYSTDQTLHWADPLNDEMNDGNMTSIMMPGQPPAFPWNQHYSGPIPAVVHLHGGEVPPEIDGGPDAWFTSDGSYKGHGYYTDPTVFTPPNASVYTYPNTQEAAMIWFHDHLLGGTRLNVYAGLAGAYALIDPALALPAGLTPVGLKAPNGSQDPLVPLVIQDRMFDTTGQLYFPSGAPWTTNPDHPFWVPEFVGDTIVVNGKAWPYLDVEPRRYRFLIINGSNARTYELSLQSTPIWQIGTDGGYLNAPVKIGSGGLNVLRIMPGERADIIIDFGGSKLGTKLVMKNSARTPYPKGAAPNGTTLGQIIQFRVSKPLSGADISYNPAAAVALRATPITPLVNAAAGTLLVTPAKTRALTLNEVMGMPVTIGGVAYPGGPLEILVNNTKWDGMRPDMDSRTDFTADDLNGRMTFYSELPNEGDTEVWEIVNLTADAHPIHTHLTQFQLISRQDFNLSNYAKAYAAAFPGGGMNYAAMPSAPFAAGVFMPAYGPPLNYAPSALTGNKYGGNPDVTPYLQSKPEPPDANEAGWKDTVMAFPGQVTKFAVRYAPTDKAVNAPDLFYPFNPGGPYRYVWHCHIIDHEDNEMMRPLLVIPNGLAARTKIKGVDY